MNYYSQYNNNQNIDQPGLSAREASAEAVLAEKRRLFAAGNALGGGLIIFIMLPYLVSYGIRYALPYLGQYAVAVAGFLGSFSGKWIYQAVVSSLVFILPFCLAALFYGQPAHRCVMFAAPRKKALLPLIMMGIGCFPISNMMGSMFESIFQHESVSTEDMTGTFAEHPLAVVMIILAVSVLPALVEEFAYRGVVLGVLRNVSEPFAIFVSALLFGLMHGNLTQIPFAFILGLGLGFVAVKSGSVWPACLLHFINNFVSVVSTYISHGDTSVTYAFNVTVFIAEIVIGVMGIILFVKKEPDGFNITTPAPTLSGPKKFGHFFSAPAMVIYLILAVADIAYMELGL